MLVVKAFLTFNLSCRIVTGMSQDNLIKLKSSASGHSVWTTKNKKKLAGVKLSLKKYDPIVRKRVVYKESKK